MESHLPIRHPGELKAFRLDAASPTVQYLGYTKAGGATGEAIWQIKRLSISGDSVTAEWADGDVEFDNVWDNRASLSYS